MTDNAETQATEEKSGGGIISLVLWVFVAVAAIGGGFATPYLVDSFQSPADTSESTASSRDNAEPPALVEFGEVVVNLNESRLNRYLRLNISLLVNQSEQLAVQKSVEENQPILKSWLLSYLADKRMDDIRGATGQNRLRREIQSQFNSVMFPGDEPRINNVLFQDFNIQ
ncbi:MAG: flagellar basal body-associated FliL family protein [Pirellulaceae bacterium]